MLKIIAVIIGICVWIAFSYLLQRLAKRLNDPRAADAWIPFLQFILLCDLAGVSRWWTVGLLFPHTHFFIFGYVGYWLAKRLKKQPPYFGVLLGIHPIGLIVLWEMLRGGGVP